MADTPMTATQVREELKRGFDEIKEQFEYAPNGIERAVALAHANISLLGWAVGRLIAIEEAREPPHQSGGSDKL